MHITVYSEYTLIAMSLKYNQLQTEDSHMISSKWITITISYQFIFHNKPSYVLLHIEYHQSKMGIGCEKRRRYSKWDYMIINLIHKENGMETQMFG